MQCDGTSMHVGQAGSSLTNGFPAFYGRRRLSLINQWMAWRGVGYTQHQHSRLPEPRVVARSRNIVTAPRPPPLHIAAIAHRCCCCSSPAPVLEDRSLPLVRPATLILPLDSAWRKQACRASVTTSSTAQPSPPPPKAATPPSPSHPSPDTLLHATPAPSTPTPLPIATRAVAAPLAVALRRPTIGKSRLAHLRATASTHRVALAALPPGTSHTIHDEGL
jgi:hypothetical protein